MTRTWEDRGWPYAPAIALALGPYLVFVVRVVFGSACRRQEARTWGVAVAVGAIVAYAYLVLTMTLSGVWAVAHGSERLGHAARLAAVQLCVGAYFILEWPMGAGEPRLSLAFLLDPLAWVGLSPAAGGVIVLATVMARWSYARYRGDEAG